MAPNEPTVFVKTTSPNVVVNSRIYPTGSVVDVPESLAKRLIADKHAVPHSGPAFEPPSADDVPARAGKNVETATLKTRTEKAV